MKEPLPRRRRVNKYLPKVNRFLRNIDLDIVGQIDLADYIGLADPGSVDKFLKSRGFIVTGKRRDDE